MTLWTTIRIVMAAGVALYSASAQARFLQADPMGYQAGPDVYSYANGDPTDNADPFGKDPCPTIANCIRSDNFMSERSNHQTTVNSKETDQANLHNIQRVQSTSSRETLYYTVRNPDGTQSVQKAGDVEARDNVSGKMARDRNKPPAGAVNVMANEDGA